MIPDTSRQSLLLNFFLGICILFPVRWRKDLKATAFVPTAIEYLAVEVVCAPALASLSLYSQQGYIRPTCSAGMMPYYSNLLQYRLLLHILWTGSSATFL